MSNETIPVPKQDIDSLIQLFKTINNTGIDEIAISEENNIITGLNKTQTIVLFSDYDLPASFSSFNFIILNLGNVIKKLNTFKNDIEGKLFVDSYGNAVHFEVFNEDQSSSVAFPFASYQEYSKQFPMSMNPANSLFTIIMDKEQTNEMKRLITSVGSKGKNAGIVTFTENDIIIDDQLGTKFSSKNFTLNNHHNASDMELSFSLKAFDLIVKEQFRHHKHFACSVMDDDFLNVTIDNMDFFVVPYTA